MNNIQALTGRQIKTTGLSLSVFLFLILIRVYIFKTEDLLLRGKIHASSRKYGDSL